MDLEYWLDYLILFGVKHKVPYYDGMSSIVWFNLDLAVAALLLIFMCYRFVKWWFRLACLDEEKLKEE